MSLNILKLQLIHKLSSNIDMMQLYKMSTLHKECFYQAINKNTDIIEFLKDLGFNVYNTEIYRKRILRGGIEYRKRMKTRYAQHSKENKEMIYIQRKHK